MGIMDDYLAWVGKPHVDFAYPLSPCRCGCEDVLYHQQKDGSAALWYAKCPDCGRRGEAFRTKSGAQKNWEKKVGV